MSKMQHFSTGNIFSKIAKRCMGLFAPSALKSSILVTWSSVIWPNCGFSSWYYNEIELQKIVMTPFQWLHHHYVTEKRYQDYVTIFSQFGPLPIKIYGYASDHNSLFCQIPSVSSEGTSPSPSRSLWSDPTTLLRSQPSFKRKENSSCSAWGHSLQDLTHLLDFPASEPLRCAIFGTTFSIFVLWSRP